MACFNLIFSLSLGLVIVSITAAFILNDGPCSIETDVGEPLFLTPLIDSGKINLAQELSFVKPFPGFYYRSHSGFITINDKYFSNMFFWFIHAQKNSETAPCILFFNGGPGISAMYGLFGEIGPFSLNSRLWLEKRDYNWVENYNVIFADIPIGAGYSFTNDSRGYPSKDTDAATQALQFLTQFFKLFPKFMNNDLYIAAESYSGKVVGILGKLIHQHTSNTFQLKGVIAVSGFVNPLTVIKTLGTHWLHSGLIDQNQQKFVENVLNKIERLYYKGKTSEAFSVSAELLFAASRDTFTYFTEFTGMTDYSDQMVTNIPAVFNDYQNFVQCNIIRERLHVGNSTFRTGIEVTEALVDGIFDSAISDYDFLLNKGHRVLWINGNMDSIVNPAAVDLMVSQLIWPGEIDFKQAERNVWRVCNSDVDVAGYVKSASNFTFVMIRNTGHMVPHNAPRAALCALDEFIGKKSCRC